jgi:hypothetical protein
MSNVTRFAPAALPDEVGKLRLTLSSTRSALYAEKAVARKVRFWRVTAVDETFNAYCRRFTRNLSVLGSPHPTNQTRRRTESVVAFRTTHHSSSESRSPQSPSK